MNWSIWISFGAINVALFSAYQSYRSRKTVEAVSSGQMVPRLQVRLLKFIKGFPRPQHGTIIYEIFNHTNFIAYQIKADFRYSDNDWIGDWNKGKIQELEKKGSQITTDELNELSLRKAGDAPVPEINGFGLFQRQVNGSIPSDLSDRAKVSRGFPILSRVVWYSEKGQRFEEIVKFKMICTRVGNSEEFSFLSGDL